jgi:UPF0716 family protein affecting phage T7 exclusion
MWAEDLTRADALIQLAQAQGAAPLPHAVAGLVLSAAKVLVTSPGAATAMCILLVCRTPPTSDLFDALARSRSIVVSLFPFELSALLGQAKRRHLRNQHGQDRAV